MAPAPPAPPLPFDPQALLESLDAARLTARLRELDRERRALLVLLRAARARQRNNTPAADCEAHHAAD
ncbi:MAG: hypothetical protein HYS12_02510 [Planctomycetes bacterium]|nr:hypothetical protein [Planctomycetota bacterium]